MFRILSIVTMLLFSKVIGQCQTYVSGGIFTSTSWILTGNPYIVTGNIIVFPGATLTIQPGVIIKFDNGTNMEIQGELVAQGTAADSIIFTSSSSAPTSGIWGGLNHWNDINLDYVKMMYAHEAIGMTGTPDLQINHSYFAFNDSGIYWFGYNETESINNSLFEKNGVAIGRAMNADIISNCIFIDNGVGIELLHYTLLTSSSFYNHSIIAVTSINGDVIGNHFENNNIGLQAKVFDFGWKTINNSIINNQIGLKISGDISSTPNTNVYGNTICNNLIYNVEVYNNVSVFMQNNCFCTIDSIAIANSIYDAYDNLSLGVAFFSPFQTNCATGIVETEELSKILFYPNPISSEGILQTNSMLKEATLEIFDSYGRNIQIIENISGQSIVLDHEKYKTGLYFIKIKQDNKILGTTKFIAESN